MNLPKLKGAIRERGRNYNQCSKLSGKALQPLIQR